MRDRRVWGWLAPTGVAVLALVLRLWNLAHPGRLVFDETYYAKDAWSLLGFGYVREYTDRANERIEDGVLTRLTREDPAQIAHPDAGKWLIALGEQVFGMNAFGWRVSAAVIGALTVLVLARLVLRMTGSILLGTLAALLLTFDGLHFVMSRTALLDVFLAFWVVCAVACLVADHDWMQARIARLRPLRPWQLAAGVCFGLACGTKWNGLYVLAAFGLSVVAWEVLARWQVRRATGVGRGALTTTALVALPAFASLVLVALVVYVLTWAGFLWHHDLYAQRFGAGDPPWGSWVHHPSSGAFGGALDALRTLWHYHLLTWDFHTGDYLADATHPYSSHPWGWLVLERPVAFDAVNDIPAERCGAPPDSSCIREVLALGNPAVWWTGVLALLAAPALWLRSRDWRWSVPLVAVAASWLPWFVGTGRPIFQFYAVAIVPFTIVAICLVINHFARHVTTVRGRYATWAGAGILLVTTVTLFCWFHPVLTGDLMTREAWESRMWLPTWI
ncbi:dolichyl-phosphate-mannose--protein mannosyltransferase [Aeromicrobium sp. CTD01-1L150]|uniref:dolichyl-phosphate-mannose--protein mannosyltransferase n=1 Tax=Aeromicrobium sp. CTD01-1L150 TaxID=3341830 RepID=UPI0035C17262